MTATTLARDDRSSRRRRWAVLALSAAAHLAAFALLAHLKGDVEPLAETPAIQVRLVDLAPRQARRTPAATPSKPSAPRLHVPAPPPAPVEPGPATPTPDAARTEDLFSAPFLDGRRAQAPAQPRRPRCDPKDRGTERESADCRREAEAARAFTRASDPDKDEGADGEFAREARHKEAMKRYHELPGDAGYPGIGCAVFHRC
ncbi:hypothetical protein [Phenylobacterium sp.]|uniref:hypothetical protein n=1 Tax=Phenylobacterium sp. TaxID=1871053 RepID=UPI0035B26B31